MSGGKLPVAGQAVGYGRPPTEYQFQKGRSGNPGGRPRGSKNKLGKMDAAQLPTDNLILAEAYRPVTIREGERTIEIPAIQAAVRSLAIAAMKGSRLSQRALADLVRAVEERKSSEHQTALENAFEYQQQWTIELERRRKLGITDLPDPVPHPEDIIINLRSGHVRTEGPLDEREKKDWDLRLARRTEAQEEVNAFAEKRRRVRSPEQKQMWLEELHFEQRIFDIINDSLPKRYKAQLANRSFAEGASREGKAFTEYARDRIRRKGK